MSKITPKKYGNAPKDGSFTGNFTRSGVDGQYRDELHVDTINFVKNNFQILVYYTNYNERNQNILSYNTIFSFII